MDSEALTTVGIPLYRGSEWIEVVAGNVERLRRDARVLVSDPVGDDVAFDSLRREFAADSRVEFVGPRTLGTGWVPHCNDLLRRATTPYFMWLPQDDDLGADWIREGEAMLRDATIQLAVGFLDSAAGPGLLNVPRMHLRAEFEVDDRSQRLSVAGQCLVRDLGALGIAFRGLFRPAEAPVLPTTADGGAWSDVFWVCAMLARGRFGSMPTAAYRKRWRPMSTHRSWPDFGGTEDLGDQVLLHVESGLGGASVRDLAAILNGALAAAQASATETELAHRGHAAVVERLQALETQVAALEGQRIESEGVNRALTGRLAAREAELEGVYRSRSWRLAAPLRGLRRCARRGCGA